MARRPQQIPWIATGLALAAMLLCIHLGFWQLQRAGEKARWLDEMTERQQGPEHTVAELIDHEQPAHYPVRVEGSPDQDHTILLDNRIHQGVAGYHVLTPVETDQGQWLLLNRGWWPRGASRERLPEIPVLPERISVRGTSYVYSDRVFTLQEDDLQQAQWPLRVQKVDMQALGDLLQVPLLPFEVRVDEGQPLETGEQMVREWTGNIMSPARHHAYAVQWFALAAAVAVIFLLALVRQRHKNESELDV